LKPAANYHPTLVSLFGGFINLFKIITVERLKNRVQGIENYLNTNSLGIKIII